MLCTIHPKLPMRNKAVTAEYYIGNLGFQPIGDSDFEGYLMLKKRSDRVTFF